MKKLIIVTSKAWHPHVVVAGASYAEHVEDSEKMLAAKVAKEMNKRTMSKVTEFDYMGWLDDSNVIKLPYSRIAAFDKAVKTFLGKENYQSYSDYARLDGKLLYELRLGPDKAGGMTLKTDFSKSKGK